MLQAYGKTADEWGDVPAEVRLFHEIAWNEEQERRDDATDDSGLQSYRR